MEIYRIKAITEADFGCEETGRKEPAALLQLINIKDAPEAAEPKYLEAAESTLAEQGINEGDKVIITESGDIKKYVRVAAAIIVRKSPEDGRNMVFATQRGYGEYKDGWEFPGGKVEENETTKQALIREIREELDTEIEVGELIDTIEYDYPKFHLSMDCYRCKMVKGKLTLKEHEAARWLDKDSIDSVNWLPADMGLIERIKRKKH
ncbi:MAG: (deoxy)nucleoside triphosphate pyrophosphohydrolase [Lachnospiraceae bacterium]|nr:(deoxy)nucleoside triphosphate pyrophosphohydrolase [Lachnospiraceae bacterium]